MGTIDGHVAFITGAARGQGRAHAVRLARAGANIVAVDICSQIPSVPYPMASKSDLDETAALVEKVGREVLPCVADVRDASSLAHTVDDAISAFGRIDIVVANAGIGIVGDTDDVGDEVAWDDVVGVNMTGVWNTVRVAVPALMEGGRGGSVVMISSTSGLKGTLNKHPADLAYTAAKHGVIGLMKAYALALAPHSIRVNAVLPGGVATPMLINDHVDRYFTAHPELKGAFGNPLPIDHLSPDDIAEAVAWLVSPGARYVTGVALPVDAGFVAR
jgi:SDR family mycofactocin-dependent oxidoreductase